MTSNVTESLQQSIFNNSTDSSSHNWRFIERIAFDMETVYLWVILALGLPGNCATIVTVTRMAPAKSLTVYIALLAVVDNLAIISKLLIFVLVDNNVHIGKAGCRILGYFGNFLSTFANWLLVALSVERFAAVFFPLKVAKKWTFKKSTITVCLMALILSLTFLHLFWTMTFVDDIESGSVYCSAVKQYMHFLKHVWYWINVMLYATIPCVLLTVFNLLIIAGIVKSRKINKYLKSTPAGSTVSSGTDHYRQITIMLVTAAITLVVLTTPRCVILILTPKYDPPANTVEGSVYYLMDTIAFVLCDFTHAVNFYVYSLSAQKFRNQFIELLTCRNQQRKRSSHYYSLSLRPSVKNVSFRDPHGDTHGSRLTDQC